MAITKVTLAKEHDDGVEYLYPKTSSDIVTHKNKHGDETNINNFLSDINNIPGVLDIENGGTSATTGPNAIHNLTNGKIEVNENNKVVINANVNISGTTTSGEKLTVSNGGADINGKLTVTGGDIEATSNNIKGNTLQSVNGTTVGNKLTVSTGGASINGNLTVTNGNANISGTTTSGGKLTVNRGGADITGNTIISGNLTSHGALTIEDGYGATIDGDVTISGTTTSGGKLTVTNGGADINGNISFHNPVTLDDKLTITNNGLEVQNSGDIITNGGAIKGFSMDITSRADVGELVVKRGIGIENNGMSIRNGGGASIDGHLTVTNGTINGAIPYGSCSTAAATAAKTVTVNGTYSLVTGARVVVKFTVTNTTENPTLNVNSTGAKAIYYRGYAISAGTLAANRTYEFVYNGTQYELVGDIDTNTDSQEIYVGPSNAPVNASIEDPMVVLSTNNGTYITAFKLKGSKATTVSSDSKKNITISSTDTKVTSVENHYAPETDSNSKIEVDAKNATNAATWNNTNLVTGVNLQRDSKGHVTGMTLDSIKMPTNPNTDTSTTLDGHYTPSANSNSKIEVDAKNATEAATWNVTNLVTGVNLQRDSKGHVTGMTLDSIKMPTNPNTHCTTHLYAGSGSAANATTTDGSTKLTIADNDTVRNSIILKGKGTTTVTSDDNGVITINSTGTQPTAQSRYSIDADGDSTSPSGARIKLQKNEVDDSSVKIYGSGLSTVSKDNTGIKISTPFNDLKIRQVNNVWNADGDYADTSRYREYTFNGDKISCSTYNFTTNSTTNVDRITISCDLLGAATQGHIHNDASYNVSKTNDLLVKIGNTNDGFMTSDDKFMLKYNLGMGKTSRDLTLADGSADTLKNPIGDQSIAIGTTNISSGYRACAIGTTNTAKSKYAFAIGVNNYCSKSASCAHNYIFGYNNSINSSNDNIVMIGIGNTSGAKNSFIFGRNNSISARSPGSIALGCNSVITGDSTNECSPECVAIAGGKIDIESANVLTVPVYKKGTKTIYNNEKATMAGHSLSYGMFSRTFSPHAVSFGTGCFAGDIGSFVCGMAPATGYASDGSYDSAASSGVSRRQTIYGLEAGVDTNVFVVGNGNYITDEGADGTNHPVTYDETNQVYIHTFNHSNVLRVTYRGGIYANGQYHSNGADYAEFIKEWWDGNPDNEDRVGYMVTIGEDNKLHKANEGDYIIGITSGNPSVIGNADEEYFWKYEKDRFNRIVMEETPVKIQEEQSDGSMVEKEIMISNKKFSANYDKDKPYIQRANRPEWDYVGMRGIVPCRDDGTCIARGFCRCGANGIATKADTRGYDTYYVIERIDDETISVEVR